MGENVKFSANFQNEAEIMVGQDAALSQWLGEIMSDTSLYHSADFNWFSWVHETKNELCSRAGRLGLRPLLENKRAERHRKALEPDVIKPDVVSDPRWQDEDDSWLDAA